MRQVFKYKLKYPNALIKGAYNLFNEEVENFVKVLGIKEMPNGQFYMWVLIDPDINISPIVMIDSVGTGWGEVTKEHSYIATSVNEDTGFVWHFFSRAV